MYGDILEYRFLLLITIEFLGFLLIELGKADIIYYEACFLDYVYYFSHAHICVRFDQCKGSII